MKTLLIADWTNLLVATFETDKKFLSQFLPAKTELNDWNGKYFMSLVGFTFSKPSFLKIPAPFYRKFGEINLRFYVKYRNGSIWKKGVVFIKEIAPSRLVGLTAKLLYHENFIARPVKFDAFTTSTGKNVEYNWLLNKNWNSLKMQASMNASSPDNSIESFIADHYWGYTKDNNKTYEFEIQHPAWNIYPALSFEMNMDAEKTYGKNFVEYFRQKPLTAFLMDGSQTKVSYPVLL